PDGLAPAAPRRVFSASDTSSAGGVKAPASTTLASVMVVCGSAIDARLSHEAAAPRVRLPRAAARTTAHNPPLKIFIASPRRVVRLPPSPPRGFGGHRSRPPRTSPARLKPET